MMEIINQSINQKGQRGGREEGINHVHVSLLKNLKPLCNEQPSAPQITQLTGLRGLKKVPVVLSWWVTGLISPWPRLLLVLFATVGRQISFSTHAMIQRRLESTEIISPQTYLLAMILHQI